MATKVATPVLAKGYRAITLEDGAVTASSEGITGKGFVSISISAETEEASEITRKDFTGGLCLSTKSNNSLKGFTLEIEFCDVNPDVLTTMTNAEPYVDSAGDVIGFTTPSGSIDKEFSLELWVGLTNASSLTGPNAPSGYMLLPRIKAGIVGNIEMTGEDAVKFSMTGAYTMDDNQWGTGPFNVLHDGTNPVKLPTALDPSDHVLLLFTGLTNPAFTNELSVVVPD